MKKKPTFSLKDILFNEEKVMGIATSIKDVYPLFRDKKFTKDVVDQFPELELKERISWIRISLEKYLPLDYQKAVTILVQSLPPALDPTKTDDDFGSFILAPYSDFVARNGCTKKNFTFSLNALREMTKRFSVEDSIRYFLVAYPAATLKELDQWTVDKNYHVRRLVSEGTRPSLPWSQKVTLDQKITIALLDKLYCDDTRYVVRSVANHMNDIAKQDASLAIKTLKRWRREGKQTEREMAYLTRHALRTLVKEGHPDALTILGYSPTPKVSVKSFEIIKRHVFLGESVEFHFCIVGGCNEKLMIDYVMTFAGKSVKPRRKVFKIAQRHIIKGETLTFTKKHALKEMTTHHLYSGKHSISLQINGNDLGGDFFTLTI